MKKNALPQLNVAKQEDLLSTPINQMVVYDHLTKSLNRTHYAGRDLYWFAGDAIANIAKKRIDNALLAEGKQVVARAVKAQLVIYYLIYCRNDTVYLRTFSYGILHSFPSIRKEADV